LAGYLDLVEVNSTFYALPSVQNAERWASLVADRPSFRFAAKVHGDFTHEEWGPDREAQARAYEEGLTPLARAGRLAALLVQFPVFFREEAPAWERLERIRALFSLAPLVLEVRHRSWFTDVALARLGRLGYAVAHLDLPSAADHPPLAFDAPGEIGYLRLHGRNAAAWFRAGAGRDERYDYLYAPREVEDLARRARAIAAKKAETLVVTNNHFAGKAVANALELRARLEGRRVPAPAPLLAAFPALADFAESPAPEGLFES
jgi:uncharacterized protein YecE (DUF72 family)